MPDEVEAFSSVELTRTLERSPLPEHVVEVDAALTSLPPPSLRGEIDIHEVQRPRFRRR
jgi:hypothetical protein